MDHAPQIDREPPSLARALEALACGLILFMLSNALIGPLLDPTQAGGEDMPVLRLMWLPVYGLILALAAWRAPRILRFWFPAALLGLLIFWVFASASWSFEPSTTNRRAVAVAFTTLFGLYFAASFDGRRMAEIIASTFLVLAIGGALAAVAYPTMGVQHDINAGDWRGLWFEKNQMGAMMVYGALGAVAALLAGSPRRKTWIFTILLCAAMIVMSRSKTSLLCLMIVLGGAAMLAILRKGPATAVATIWLGVTAALAAGATFWLAPEAVFRALGKDPTLTGRTEIWEALLRQSQKAPLTGFGYAVFWRDDSVPAAFVRHDTGWNVPTAHNGWLDTLVQLGWVGVILVATILGLAVLTALFRFRTVRDGYWAPLFLVIFLIVTLSESFILERNGIAWALCCAAVARMLGPVLGLQPAAARAPLPAPAPLEWRLAPVEPVEYWTATTSFGRRTVSPFGSRTATGTA